MLVKKSYLSFCLFGIFCANVNTLAQCHPKMELQGTVPVRDMDVSPFQPVEM
jgi:hypothetical protein